MKKPHVNKLRMLDAFLSQLDTAAEPVNQLPNFSDYAEELSALVTGVGTYYRQQLENSLGISEDKRIRRSALKISTGELVKRCRAYAVNSNDYTRFGAINMPVSRMNMMPQTQLNEYCSMVVQLCTDNLELLADYGVTQAMIDAATADREAYRQIMPEVKVAIAKRTTATAGIAGSFEQLAVLLQQMDQPVAVTSESYPEFYKSYKSLRKVDNLKGRSSSSQNTGISGTVVNLSTGLTQEGVTMTVVGANLVTLTDNLGFYSFKLSKAGIYSVSAYLKGFETVVDDDVEVTEGNMTTADFNLEPATTE